MATMQVLNQFICPSMQLPGKFDIPGMLRSSDLIDLSYVQYKLLVIKYMNADRGSYSKTVSNHSRSVDWADPADLLWT